MRNVIKWAALIFAMPLFAIAGTPPALLEFGGSATVAVDATGKAHVIEMKKVSKLEQVPAFAPIVERIKGRLKDVIESWQFVPAMRDGIAVGSQTSVVVELEGMDDGAGGMAVRVRSAGAGAGMRHMDTAPLVVAVTKAQEEGLVRLHLAYDDAGKVVDADIIDSKELSGAGFTGKADSLLCKAALSAARTWELEPEVVDGHPRAGTGSITLIFCLDARCETTPMPGGDAEKPQQFASSDPAVKVRSNVAGTLL